MEKISYIQGYKERARSASGDKCKETGDSIKGNS